LSWQRRPRLLHYWTALQMFPNRRLCSSFFETYAALSCKGFVYVSGSLQRIDIALQQVYLGAEYVNNKTLSDVTFLVEGQRFNAHRIALLASSDTFRAMFDLPFKEKDASTIPIPNIRFVVFEAMMRCIYTGMLPVLRDNLRVVWKCIHVSFLTLHCVVLR
jgi:BTB/POZ domain